MLMIYVIINCIEMFKYNVVMVYWYMYRLILIFIVCILVIFVFEDYIKYFIK